MRTLSSGTHEGKSEYAAIRGLIEKEHPIWTAALVRVRDPQAAQSALASAGFPAGLAREGTFELTGPAALDHPEEIAALLVRSGAPPTHLVVEQEDLEKYFLRLVGEDGGLK